MSRETEMGVPSKASETSDEMASESFAFPAPSTHPPPMNPSTPLTPAFSYLHLDPEKIIKGFGNYGTYQMIIYAMSNIGSIIYAMETMIMSLIAAEINFECVSNNPFYSVKDKCNVIHRNGTLGKCGQIPGTKFSYLNGNRSTLITEFDLVCDKSFWSQHGTSIFMIGGLVMTPIVTQLADRYGRRFCFLIPLWLTVISNIACSLAPSYLVFLLCRFFAGMGTAGIGTVSYVIQIESVTASFRSMTPLIGTFVWVSGYMIIGLLYLFINDWRNIYLAMSLPGVITFSFYWLMPESIHWSITNNRTKKVKKYIKFASRMNRRELCLHECTNTDRSQSTIEKAASRSVLDLFRKKSLFFHLVLHCFIMMVLNGTYWALSLFSVELHEDELVGYFLSGLVELPAGFIAIGLLGWMGRRTVTSLSLLCSSLCMFMAVIFPGKNYISMSFPLLAKMFNSITWASEPLLLGEMSPTSVRNVFYGLIGFLGEVASVFAPYLNRLKTIHELAPSFLISVASVIAAIFALASPETKDQPLPEDLDDFDSGPVFKWLSGLFSSKEEISEYKDPEEPMKKINDTNSPLLN